MQKAWKDSTDVFDSQSIHVCQSDDQLKSMWKKIFHMKAITKKQCAINRCEQCRTDGGSCKIFIDKNLERMKGFPFADLLVTRNLDSPDANSTFDKEFSEANNSTTWQVNVANRRVSE